MKNSTKKSILLAGIFLLSFILINILISTIMYIFKVPIQKYYLLLSLLLTILTITLLLKKVKILKKEYIIISVFLPIIIIVVAIFLNSKVYDLSWDGNNYHKPTIGFLKDGWNPLYESCSDFVERDNNLTSYIPEDKLPIDLWIDHYARATHIFQANTFAFTDNINSGKSINTIVIISVFLITFSFGSIYFNKLIFPIILGISIISYPLVGSQFLTTYIDLHVYLYLLCLIVSFLMIEYDKEDMKKIGLILYVISLLMLINIKFTSFAYAGIYCLGFYIYYIIKLIKHRETKKFFIKFTIITIISVLIGIFIIGLSVYIKNMLEHSNPFYPLFGKNKVEIILQNQPEYFENKSAINKYFISMFSEVNNIVRSSKEKAKYKIPLTISENELIHIDAYDIRISGNGLFYSGIFIMTLLSLILLSKKIYLSNSKMAIISFITILITIILILLLSESWWARYFPQTYFLTIFAEIYLYINSKNKLSLIFLTILLTLLFHNNFYILFKVIDRNYKFTISTNSQFNEILNSVNPETEKILIKTNMYGGPLYDVKYKLKEYDLEISELDPLESYSAMETFINWKPVPKKE